MSTPADKLFLALRKKVGFEVVSQAESPNQLRILGRIPGDRLGSNEGNWKIVKWRLLKAMESRPWKVDLSKSYFIKKETDKMVFAWRILLQGEDIAQHYADVISIIESSPQSRAEVMEIPLLGNSRNDTAGGKRGAGPAGMVPVGPMAVQNKMRGG
jgi:hypothetical protein